MAQNLPQPLALGSVVEALPNSYHALIGLIGARYKIARVTQHAGGPCYWGQPAATRRIPGKGRTPPVEIGQYLDSQQCPLGDGSDFRLIASAN
jgi:hypothetical protein